MKIAEIIESCLFLLDRDELASSLEVMQTPYNTYLANINGDDADDLWQTYLICKQNCENNNKIIKNLKFLCNKVFKLISVAYFPCLEREIVEICDGEFDLTTLNKKFFKVKSLKKTNGSLQKFEILKSKLITQNGKYELTYYYDINIKDYFEEINDFPPCITYSSIVDGVLGEYYMLNGFYEEANFYLQRFESQMQMLNTKTHEVKLKERKWA